eukprot:gene8639-9526_t
MSSFLHIIIFVNILVILHQTAVSHSQTVSYTATGRWEEETNPHYPWKCQNFLCLGANKTWIPNNPEFVFYNNETACQALLDRGISLINFYGDSYQRQLYAAMLITLNGDFQYGSLSQQSKDSTCSYHRQFYEKKCGVRQLNHQGFVCGGKILLDPILTGIDNLNNCLGRNGSLSLLTFGNHRLSPPRYGVNNATAYAQFYRNGLCKQVNENNRKISGSYHNPCSIWWVSTHFRRVGYFPDEKEDVVMDYNLGMRRFFDSKACGNINYVDVYNMTRELVKEHWEESQSMTYDNVHWGMEVNLMKAQIVLNAILRSPK